MLIHERVAPTTQRQCASEMAIWCVNLRANFGTLCVFVLCRGSSVRLSLRSVASVCQRPRIGALQTKEGPLGPLYRLNPSNRDGFPLDPARLPLPRQHTRTPFVLLVR